jgi:hypothetical protein
MAHSNFFSSRPSSSTEHVSSWQNAYEAVMAETDTGRLFKLVEVAEAAVLTRRPELEGSADHHAEREALEKAVAHLKVVKRERLRFR